LNQSDILEQEKSPRSPKSSNTKYLMWLPTATLPNLRLSEDNVHKTIASNKEDASPKSLSPNRKSPHKSNQNIPKLNLSLNTSLDAKSMSPSNNKNSNININSPFNGST